MKTDNLSFRIVEITKRNKDNFSDILSEWDEFVYNHPLGNIFQTSYYANIFSERFLDWYLVILLEQNEIVGGMLSQVWPYLGFRNYRLATFKSVYGPLILEKEEYVPIVIRSMFDKVIKIKPLQHIILTSSYRHSEEIKNLGYSEVHHAIKGTFIIDLRKSEKELWRSLEKRCRYAIKRAQKLGVRIVKMDRDFSPYLYYRIHLETARRLNITPNPLSFYTNIWRNLADKFADFYFALFDNKPIAAAIIFKYKNMAYYYSSALLKEFKNTNAMNLLIWNLLLNLKDEGYKFFDMLFHPAKNDTESPEYGLYIFKRSFGGQEVPIFHTEKIFSPMFKFFIQKSFELYNIVQFMFNKQT
jgi:hypothetical protein